MYTIEEKPYGIKLTFSGQVTTEEMQSWLDESGAYLARQKDNFCVFVDMRTLIPLSEGPRKVIRKGQKVYKNSGMARSVVILSNPVVTMQFKQIAHDTGIYEYERYIDASHDPNWEQAGLDWLEKCIDPDQRPRALVNA